MECQLITALASPPDNPDILLAGSQPGAIYRSEDAGQSWRNLNVPIAPYASSGFREHPAFAGNARENRPISRHWTRVTQIVFDPQDSSTVWAGVEIDGAWLSRDGGLTFEQTSKGFKTGDVHGFAVVAAGEKSVFATTNKGLYVNREQGGDWELQEFDSPWSYTRSILACREGDGTLFMTNGNGAPGTAGRLYRSDDFGANWSDVALPGQVESSVYFLATDSADPNNIFASTALGQLYRSTNGGHTWVALSQRLGEVRALLWSPN
jgi:photosystem II stability/assembly factor-like uncharacterized protein